MLRDIKPIIGPTTKVLSLLNGLGHATTMRRYVPDESIMVGVTMWLAGLKGPGHAHLEGPVLCPFSIFLVMSNQLRILLKC